MPAVRTTFFPLVIVCVHLLSRRKTPVHVHGIVT